MEFHEIANIFPMMLDDEYANLKSSIELNGLAVPIIIFEDKILDGRNRYKACQELGITPKYDFFNGTFDEAINFVWIHNFERRHLNSSQAAMCTVKKRKLVEFHQEAARERQREAGELYGKGHPKVSQKVDEPMQHLNSAQRAIACTEKAQKYIDEHHEREKKNHQANERRTAQKLADLAGTNRQYISDAEKILEEHPEKAKEILEGKKRIPQVRKEIKKEQFKKEVENTKTAKVLDQKYRTIILDPPWPSDKFIRECRPNQDTLDYNQMSLEEIGLIKIPEISYDDGFIFLWTTQKFIPLSFNLIAQWGFKYFFTMVWHKNGGPQPYEMPQFNCEFVICGKKGNIQFLDFKNFFTCFDGKRREHSRKPDEFYELIKRVTPEPRIDYFSREKRDGFEQYGNEPTKFSNR